jgi:hypothetical protein
VAALLARELPDGLDVVGASEIDRRTPSIDESVVALAYEIDLSALDAPPEPSAVGAAVGRFLASDQLPVRKRNRNGERTVDARRAVAALAQVAPLRLQLEVVPGPDGTLKPSVIVGALLGLADDVLPLLRVHKHETRLRAAATTDTPAAVAPASFA